VAVPGDFGSREELAPPLLREAILTGLVGAVAVALWFLALDLVRGHLLFTPAALGSALFLGARGVDQVEVSALTVLGYTLVHVTAFVAVALLLMLLVRGVAYHPPAILGAALLLVTMEAFFIGILAIMASWLLDALSLWTVLVANLLAAAAMGLFIWIRNPAVQHGLQADLEERQ
jgi:hypothetical protein